MVDIGLHRNRRATALKRLSAFGWDLRRVVGERAAAWSRDKKNRIYYPF